MTELSDSFFVAEIANLTARQAYYAQLAGDCDGTSEYRHNCRVLRNRLELISQLNETKQEAYTVLRGELEHPEQYLRYFAAAYVAMRDYKQYRESKRETLEQLGKLAEDAGSAARLLSTLQKKGIALPPELRPRRDSFEFDLSFATAPRVLELAGDSRSMLDAVTFLENLSRVAAAARTQISFGPLIDRTTSKRKSNHKTAYLRAFKYLLECKTTEVFEHFALADRFAFIHQNDCSWVAQLGRPIAITPGLMEVIAETSTVALSILDRDVVVSKADVKRIISESQGSGAQER